MSHEGDNYSWEQRAGELVVSTVILGRQLWPDQSLQLVGWLARGDKTDLAKLTRDTQLRCVLTVYPYAMVYLKLFHPCVVFATIFAVGSNILPE
jgi:hypothetical protein